ncbi:hypothetical protein L1987_57923 [Smallanthus sonchifolius]|uniref:Uncharacterized protein n=1 Tax=Smallanthus sonchifolius TaxID=185202 RepID=A0ACB9DEC5_9ASTR|nr:hypothetical protein L1987_57923 [Smallanthus sonchifolius]
MGMGRPGHTLSRGSGDAVTGACPNAVGYAGFEYGLFRGMKVVTPFKPRQGNMRGWDTSSAAVGHPMVLGMTAQVAFRRDRDGFV